MEPRIIYTYTDEAPMLATHSLFPVLKAYSQSAQIKMELKDISLAARILAVFPDYLTKEQKTHDALKELGELVKKPEANIIKLPNISASIPQILAAVKELQNRGYNIPDFPEEPATSEEKEIRARYDIVKGSAVNPVLREGNSDRRVAPAVKQFARKNPHSMGPWSPDSKTHVSSMNSGDFYETEKSVTLDKDTSFSIEFTDTKGNTKKLRKEYPLIKGEILDAAVMRKKELRDFLDNQIKDAGKKDVLFSIHLKATMMKVSDPVIFGHAVSVFFAELFSRHSGTFAKLGIDPAHGMSDLEQKISTLPEAERAAISRDIRKCLEKQPELAMVDSDKGITNLHVPSDIIIDASMPAAIRNSGKMWGPDGKAKDMKAVIPDRSYAGIYQTTIDFCKKNGAFDPATMGSVSNIGLMAKKAEEYGSHDKTFIAEADGFIQAVDKDGNILLEHKVKQGDIFRMCQVKPDAVENWISLAEKRAAETGDRTVFWLDKNRAHDRELIKKVKTALKGKDAFENQIIIKDTNDACLYTLQRTKEGKNTISVTGNVLRDYLTDLFPILELGTSAKMLSIVPLMNGGGLFETGAGGSAPKHIQQLLKENHLRWDSLGEFLALTVSFEHFAKVTGNTKAGILAETLDKAVGRLLVNGKSPSRKAGEQDNRTSHFYLAMYWAQELADQNKDTELSGRFRNIANKLKENEKRITDRFIKVQGKSSDIGGYYFADRNSIDLVMRPCRIFNEIIDSVI